MTSDTPRPAVPAQPALNPGDEAPLGAPGTGEDTCLACHGSGTVQGKPCPECGATGRVTRAIGG